MVSPLKISMDNTLFEWGDKTFIKKSLEVNEIKNWSFQTDSDE
jgi:hypothetical protein